MHAVTGIERERTLQPFAAPATIAYLRRLGLFELLTMKAAG
jgi:hypothetical protein